MKNHRNFHRGNDSTRAARRRGSVITMTAFLMVVMLSCAALVVDYATLSVDANRLQRGCDAAALAAVSQLKKTTDNTDKSNATAMAINVAALNKVTITNNGTDVTFASDATWVRVTATTNRSFLFAPIMGVRSGNVRRSSRADISVTTTLTTASNGGPRVAPIGISIETYEAYKNDRTNYHDIKLIRQNKQLFGLDDLVLFDLRNNNAKSPAKMKDQLTGDETQVSSIGDLETTLNASNNATSKKFGDGLSDLMNESRSAPWYDADGAGIRYNDIVSGVGLRSNPRVINLIVTPGTITTNNGTYNTQVQGYAPVYVENYSDQGSDSTYMRVRFLPPLAGGLKE